MHKKLGIEGFVREQGLISFVLGLKQEFFQNFKILGGFKHL